MQLYKSSRDTGASLVEFAFVVPLLLLLLLGIVEFGWLLGQYNDVRHGAREGARFAAVDAGDSAAIRTHICQAMEGLAAGMTDLRVAVIADGGMKGSTGSLRVEADVSSLSGVPFISPFLPSTLASDVTFRLEQPSDSWGTFPATSVSC